MDLILSWYNKYVLYIQPFIVGLCYPLYYCVKAVLFGYSPEMRNCFFLAQEICGESTNRYWEHLSVRIHTINNTFNNCTGEHTQGWLCIFGIVIITINTIISHHVGRIYSSYV